ncbi:MAG: sugar transferase [Planctomycetota bacterium]
MTVVSSTNEVNPAPGEHSDRVGADQNPSGHEHAARAAARTSASDPAPPTPRSTAVMVPTVWGLGLTQLHDRVWASRGFQVIRPGARKPLHKGPELFILLGHGVLVDFPIGQLLRSLAWLRPQAARIRLIERGTDPYAERVIADEHGRFQSFERVYTRRGINACQVWVTPSRTIAKQWHRAKSARQASIALARGVPSDRTHITKLVGNIFDASSEHGLDLYRRYILEKWDDPANVIEGVYQPSPGVWIHETCDIHPEARIVGPVWLGAGHRLGKGQTIVGPAIVPDEPLVSPDPGPIDWHVATHSGWRLLPTFRKRPVRNVTKRLFDIGVSAMVLAATLPFYPIIALLIYREDGGPPFFIHNRQRFGGRTFGCIKFRTMRLDAEEIKQRLMKDNQADGPQFYMANDPRLLRHGGWMRRYKVDEFPQFINVLLGHMSIVGPRPSPDKENQYCPAWREARLSVRPGITGLWQVSSERKPQTDFQEWIRYDLEYVQRSSWRLDIAIIMATIKRILF